MPSHSPPFGLWFGIGGVYYAMCFIVLRHLLASRPFTPVLLMAIALVIIILLGNALWSVLFFGRATFGRVSSHLFPMLLLSRPWWQSSFAFILSGLPYLPAILSTSCMRCGGAIICGDSIPPTPNQTMKPTAPLRSKFRMFATTPCVGLSFYR